MGTSWLRVQLASAGPGRWPVAAAATPRLGGNPHAWAPAQTELLQAWGGGPRTTPAPAKAQGPCPSATAGCGAGPKAVVGLGENDRASRGRGLNPSPGESWAGAESECWPRGGSRPDPAACLLAWRDVWPSARWRLRGTLGVSGGVLIIITADRNTGARRRWGSPESPWTPETPNQSPDQTPHCPLLCSGPCLPGPGVATSTGDQGREPAGDGPQGPR